jgi:hypothetical protein
MKKTILTVSIITFLASCNSSSEYKEDNWTGDDVERIMSDSRKIEKERQEQEKYNELISQFEEDAQEIGRLICLKRKARENDDRNELRIIDAQKMELEDNMRDKYSELAKDEKIKVDKYERYVEIGRMKCGCD